MKDRYNGKVVWFSNAKGYGFVRTDEDAREIFVHFSSIEHDGYKSLKPDQRVSFRIGEGPQGRPQAESVQVVRL